MISNRISRFLRLVKRNPNAGIRFARCFLGGPPFVVIVASAHKVGSTWLYALLRDLDLFEFNHRLPDRLAETGTLLLTPESYSYLARQRGGFLYKSHSFPLESLPTHAGIRLLTIIRDPRDVLISASYYLANLPEELGGWGESFSNLSVKQRLKRLIREGDFILDRLDKWFHSPDAMVSRYESLKADAFTELRRVCDELEIVVSDSEIRRVIDQNAFERRSKGRKPGEEASSSFYRKGIIGDWRSHFDDDLKNLFKSENSGQWNRLLLEMGYEEDAGW